MSGPPFKKGGGWRPERPWRPVFTELNIMEVLDQYRRWYAEGLSDKEISLRIRMKYTLPHNPQMAFEKKR